LTDGPPDGARIDPTDDRSTDDPAVDQAAGPPAAGPPGASVFSLERRPAAGLYLVAWLLIGAGIALAFIGIQAPAGLPRLLVLVGLLALALGLAAAAGYQIVARADRPAGAYRGPSPVVLFVLIIVLVNLFGDVITLVTGSNGLDVDRPEIFLVGLLIQVVFYVGVIALFLVAPHVLTWRDMANSAGKSAVQVIGEIANAAAIMLPVTLVALIIGSLAALLIGARPPQVVPVPQSGLDVLLDGLAAVILAPLGEELFFRGFALTAWWRDLGERSALIRSTLFFALVHILNVAAQPGVPGTVEFAARQALVLLIVLLPVGYVLGWLFIKRGLHASVAAHMTYNAIIFGLTLLSTLIPVPTG
jgi:membrane protease YdiL (CAAX protease family)